MQKYFEAVILLLMVKLREVKRKILVKKLHTKAKQVAINKPLKYKRKTALQKNNHRGKNIFNGEQIYSLQPYLVSTVLN